MVPTSLKSASRRVNLMSPLGWHAHGVRFHHVLSRPDRAGEDAVLRAVVGLADRAERGEFLMCVGFAAPHAPPLIACAARRIARACACCSTPVLRGPADVGDLAAGARALLVAAPKVELYITGPKNDQRAEGVGKGKHVFQHGKFCARWNAWARSAFHEMELNMFFDAPDRGETGAEVGARGGGVRAGEETRGADAGARGDRASGVRRAVRCEDALKRAQGVGERGGVRAVRGGGRAVRGGGRAVRGGVRATRETFARDTGVF